MSRTGYFVSQYLLQHPNGSLLAAVQAAIQKTGRRDREENWRQLRDRWYTFAVFCRTLGEEAERALQNLETRGPLTMGTFRTFRKLLSEDIRLESARHALEPGVTPKKWEAGNAVLWHEQWVRFHWREENPFLDAPKGVAVFIGRVFQMAKKIHSATP